jgi:Rrf2 family protein
LQVSAKTDYALRAASELARAATEEAGPIKGDWISETQGIPKKFMENILHDLKRSGIVRTRRGASGGYWLALPAEEVSLAAIIRAVEGPLANVRGEWPEAVEYQGAAVHQPEVADIVDGELPSSITKLTRDPEAWVHH